MCGEHWSPPPSTATTTGSSPHVRGAPVDNHRRQCLLGIIPACAGSTIFSGAGDWLVEDHPRMCGEHGEALKVVKLHLGSSPHVRGALSECVETGAPGGIIPACAGSTHEADLLGIGKRDHPRMCGEHSFRSIKFQDMEGSSPHVRGARVPREVGGIGHGIIPACAGSTGRARRARLLREDHPRMCGEHSRLCLMPSMRTGSSPHVRGAPRSAGQRRLRGGIIPACAGSTRRFSKSRAAGRDHPRMCGEHTRPAGTRRRARGSSPHVRGARLGRSKRSRSAGIIPACAGSTLQSTRTTSGSRDHPRMCGEHSISGLSTVMATGSSPHVRGAHGADVVVGVLHGIIPACAGSTPTTAPWRR